MANERSSSKTDTVVKLVLVFFISLLSFSIGTFVGKKFSDNQHKLATLEPSSHSPESESVSSEEVVATETPKKAEDALSDEEIAKLAEEFITDDNSNTAREPASVEKEATEAKTVETKDSHEKETTAVTKKPEPDALTKAAERAAAGKPPVTAKVEGPRQPMALPSQVAGSKVGKFTVQVASYNNEKEAEQLAQKLKDKRLEAFYVPADVKGRQMYRVSVGLFTTSQEANAAVSEIKDKGQISGTPFVQKIVSE